MTHGEDERVMPGHALAMQTDKPFRSLQQVRRTKGQDGFVPVISEYSRAVSRVLRTRLI